MSTRRDLRSCCGDASRLRLHGRRACCRGEFTFRSRRDRSVSERSRFGDKRTSAGFSLHFRRRQGEIVVQARDICRLFLSSCLEGQGLTHRRRRSRSKIAYELIAESYFACATGRSNLQGVSDNGEMNLLKRKRSEISVLAQKIANLPTICENIQRAPEPQNDNFANGCSSPAIWSRFFSN